MGKNHVFSADVPLRNYPLQCVAGCTCVDGGISLHLQMSSSDSESTSAQTTRTTPTTSSGRSSRRTSGWVCQVLGCLASFRQCAQLATHYSTQHPCDYGPPRDASDLAIYDRCMTYPPATTTTGKRKRSPRSPAVHRRRQPKQAKTARAKPRYENYLSCVNSVFFHFESNRIVIVGLKSHQ